jgi:hypothetical protein
MAEFTLLEYQLQRGPLAGVRGTCAAGCTEYGTRLLAPPTMLVLPGASGGWYQLVGIVDGELHYAWQESTGLE